MRDLHAGYRVVYADPPWSYDDSGVRGGTDHHYRKMTIARVAALRVSEICDPRGAALLLWATCPLLDEAMFVLRSWGFRYRGVAFVWVKVAKNGQPVLGGGRIATRANAELVLLGHRGEPPPRQAADISQIVTAERQAHSAKPEWVRDRIEQLYGWWVPRVELFARKTVPGWSAWGDDIEPTWEGSTIHAIGRSRATDPQLIHTLERP